VGKKGGGERSNKKGVPLGDEQKGRPRINDRTNFPNGAKRGPQRCSHGPRATSQLGFDDLHQAEGVTRGSEL